MRQTSTPTRPAVPLIRRRRRGSKGNARYRRRLKRKLMAKSDGRCVYCRSRLNPDKATMDHVRPRSRKGNNGLANLAVCCRSCNEAKRDRTPEEWAADILAFAESLRSRRRGSLMRPMADALKLETN